MKKISVYEGMGDIPPRYEALFAEASAAAGIFSSLPWLRNFIGSALPPASRFLLYGLEDREQNHRPCMALSMTYRASFCGSWFPRKLMSAANYYSALFSLIEKIPSADTAENICVLAHAIAADSPRWDMVDMHPLDTEQPLFAEMPRAFRQAGMAVQRYFCFGNWYLEVRGRSYREYSASLPARLQHTLQRKEKKLLAAKRLQVEICTNGVNLDACITAFGQIYHASWKAAEPTPAFIPGLIRTCAAEGWLRLGIAYVDSQPAAAQIWIVHKGVASIYKLAHDRKFSALSPGTILTARLMRHVIDTDGVTEVDFLSGDDSYKRDWMSHRRERWGIMAFNLHSFYGISAAIWHLGGHAVKSWFRQKGASP